MIIACYKVINEINYLPFSISAIYDYVDKIVIVEGCDIYMKKWILEDRLTKEGLSTDGTTEFIRSLGDKVHHIPLGFVEGDELIFWNTLVQNCGIDDYCWMIDADEIYKRPDAQQLVEWMKEDKYWAIEFPMINFWHDFYHTINGGDWNPVHGRIFKILEEGMHFSDYSNFARLESGRQLLSIPEMIKKKHRTIFPIYHYSYVRSAQKILEKQMWQGGMYLLWDSNSKWKVERAKYRHPGNFITRSFSWFTCIYDQITGVWIEQFNDDHPEVMQDHPLADYHWDEKPIKVNYLDYLKDGKWNNG